MKRDTTARPGSRPRTAGLLSGALAAVLGLLCVLAPASLAGVPPFGAPGFAHGAVTATGPPAGTSNGAEVRDSCTAVACGTQPRLQSDAFAERFTAPSGAASLPARPLLTPPTHSAAPPPSPGDGFASQPAAGHYGRAPPLPTGT